MAEEDSNLANYPVFADPNKMRLHQYLRKRETEQKIKAFNARRSLQYVTRQELTFKEWFEALPV
jgi:hypothetical protein